ncbi:hypothetical protein GCM10025857_33920 [Alicyclobacillus contaminans]|uniref:hypothetical protein n=1 Tax=Alicyclobacillus contaminans TaxID=392016 RepID=UPI0003F5DE45|nr:hypothetical protein [Alicyclobacillus contaminans]GMA52035.1 hypothetical protein GCM10025857_33920 [Alicyclobacillus contaminans]
MARADENKVHRMDFTRFELAVLLGALEEAYTRCEREGCDVCWKRRVLAERIERKLPRSMVASPVALWRRRGDA